MQAFTVSDPWSKALKASVRRGIISSAVDDDADIIVMATRGGTTTMHRLLILVVESAGATNAKTSVLEDAPFRVPHEGQGVSSTGTLKDEGWIRKQDAEAPAPPNARMYCSGWKILGPRTDTW